MSLPWKYDDPCRLSAGVGIGVSVSDSPVSWGADICDHFDLDRLFMDGTVWIVFDKDDRKNSGDDRIACNVFDCGHFLFVDDILLGTARRCDGKNDVCGAWRIAKRSACQRGRTDMDAAGDGSRFSLDRYDLCCGVVPHLVDGRKNLV